MAFLDIESIDRLRLLAPREAYEEVRQAIYRSGTVSSDDFLEAFDQLVEVGVLTWDQIEEFERH